MPLLPKPGCRKPGLRIERDQLISERDGQNPLVALIVGPISDAAIVEAHGVIAAVAFIQPIHPQRFARGGIHGHGVAAHSGGEIENAMHRERRHFVVRIRARAEVLRLPGPGDLQLADVVAIDLIERRILGALRVAAVVAPFAIRRAGLSQKRQTHSNQQSRDRKEAVPQRSSALANKSFQQNYTC